MQTQHNRGLGVGSLNGTGAAKGPTFDSPELPFTNHTPSDNTDNSRKRGSYVFDAVHVIEAVRREYGRMPPIVCVGRRGQCWLCLRSRKRIGGFLNAGDSEPGLLSYGLCVACFGLYRGSNKSFKIEIQRSCERNIMAAYPYLGMEVAA